MNSQILVGDFEQLALRLATILEELNLKQEHPDVLWMDDEKLGVEQAKIIREFLSLKPYSAPGRLVVVLNAQNFTPEAQNSLLKTLEEPPEKATILLGMDSDKKILPTILSRCQVINLATSKGKNPEQDDQKDVEKLLTSTVEERFEFVEKLEDKATFLDALVLYFHSQLSSKPSQQNTNFAKELLHAEQWRDANGNIRAILEYLMLKMPN